MIHRSPALPVAGLGVALLAMASSLQAQNTAPTPRPYVVKNVRTSLEEDAPLRHLVLRDGRIEAVLEEGTEPPSGLWVLDGSDLVALPAFLDGYSHAGCETPTPVTDQDMPVDVQGSVRIDMRQANRKGIQPHFSAADVFALEERAGEGHRKSGFGLVLSAPEGEILAGRSVLASLHEAAARDRIVRAEVFDHAAFGARGGGYPSTLMGYHAQLRQFFLDAQRHGVLRARAERGVPGSRPTHDADLDAGLEILSGERRLVCEANSAKDIRRWIRLADELGLRIAISGGREAHEVAGELAARAIPVFLTLDWGDEPDDPDAKKEGKDKKKAKDDAEGEAPSDQSDQSDVSGESGEAEQPEDSPQPEEAQSWVYEEPLPVRRDRRRRWEEIRDGAKVLSEAGVRFSFVTGERKASDLLKAIRTLVEEGLDHGAAMEALTTRPAELLGVGGYYGQLAPGYSATLALWTGDPLDEGQVKWLLVDGFPYEYDVKEKRESSDEKPAEGHDLSGRWELSVDGNDSPMILALAMDEDGAVTGTVDFANPMTEERQEEEVQGSLAGKDVTLEASFSVGDLSVSWVLEATCSSPDAFNGTTSISAPGFENSSDCAAARMPERSTRRSGSLSLGGVLVQNALEAGAPMMPLQGWRAAQPICGCSKHGGLGDLGSHGHGHGHDHDDDGHDDGDDQ